MPGGADSRSPESECRPAGLNDRWTVPGVCLFLAAITFAVFGQTVHHEFVNYDDNRYVYENPVVQKGLTWEGFRWALTYGQIGHWHPLTWLSHMLDCQLYGLQAGGHHLTNILLHTATAILLFLVLRRMTGFLWRSAFVAAVFAIHPLRVESVAWISERKDVLSALFFMLTLGAYVRYVRRPPSVVRYGAVVLLYRLGTAVQEHAGDDALRPPAAGLLAAEPSFRLLPRVLLRRVAEKIPLLVLAVGSCVATALVPEKVSAEYTLSFGLRSENAVVSYVTYLWQMIHPAGLACLYPNPTNYLPFWQVAGALGLLLAISGAAWAFRQTHPGLVVGWLWYLGMMIPVIGMVQISYYAHADRYTYLPQIGLYLLLTWAAAELCAGWRHRRVMLGGCATVILVALIFCARAQTAYWRNSELLWTHTLACTSDNFIAQNNLGNALVQEGAVDEAIAHFQKALQIKPDYAEAHNNLGNALLQKGSVNEAMVHYQKALQIQPDYADAHYNLGNALLQRGAVDEAIVHFQKALQIQPDYAKAHNNLGNALLQKGAVDEAIAHYQKALQIQPDYADAHYNLGYALVQKGKVDEAISHFQRALQIKPDFAEAHYDLGYALVQKGKVDEAISHFQRALQIKPDYAEAHINLGSALLKKGKVDEAISHYQKALQIKPDFAEAHYNLGYALVQKGKADEAISHFQRALQIKPDYAEAHYNLGTALLKKGNVDEAITCFQKALHIKPDYAEAQNTLAWVLATCPLASLRDGNKAVELAQRANQLTGDGNPVVLRTLAAAYAEAGRFPEAVATAQRALQMAGTQSNPALADAIRSQMKLYQAGLPFHLH